MKTLGESEFETFGRYVFLKKLAAGGMAEVFLSRPSSRDANGRVQVVKRILPHIATQSAFLNMFQREIRIIMGFNHPHIVQLHDFGKAQGQPYIAMEYVEGKSVKEIMLAFQAKGQRIPIPVTLSLIAQAAAGLSYAHEFVNKITGEELHAIHRDISPHNLIVSYEGNLKVIDFGIAKAACSIPDFTQTGFIKGKAAYFAPEQLLGDSIDGRTDVFALGIVLWEMLTGQRLFMKEGDSDVATMKKVSECEKHIQPPSSINPDIPKDVDAIVMWALKKNPEQRIGSAKKFQILLRKAMIRHFPSFFYSHVGDMMQDVFKKQMDLERITLRELNQKAQEALVGAYAEKTETVTITTTSTNSAQRPAEKTKTPTFPLAQDDSGSAKIMDLRLSNIEKMMKQKASVRHYVLLGFYIAAMLGLKVSERWDLAEARADAAPQAIQKPVHVVPVAKREEPKVSKETKEPKVVAAKPQAAPAKRTPAATKKVAASKSSKSERSSSKKVR